MRRAERHTDEALAGSTRQWLRHLPAARRPIQLCTLFPGVAKGLAWSWREPPEALAALDDLLVDRRGGRGGFPRDVVRELRRLRHFCGRCPPLAAEDSSGMLALLRQAWPWH